MGMSSLARSVGLPLVAALFPISKIALLPLFILWFGLGEPSKIATIALGVFWR
jgi:ABC-type nitrate/sulfonate/bicarbonate transport system permease component